MARLGVPAATFMLLIMMLEYTCTEAAAPSSCPSFPAPKPRGGQHLPHGRVGNVMFGGAGTGWRERSRFWLTRETGLRLPCVQGRRKNKHMLGQRAKLRRGESEESGSPFLAVHHRSTENGGAKGPGRERSGRQRGRTLLPHSKEPSQEGTHFFPIL